MSSLSSYHNLICRITSSAHTLPSPTPYSSFPAFISPSPFLLPPLSPNLDGQHHSSECCYHDDPPVFDGGASLRRTQNQKATGVHCFSLFFRLWQVSSNECNVRVRTAQHLYTTFYMSVCRSGMICPVL